MFLTAANVEGGEEAEGGFGYSVGGGGLSYICYVCICILSRLMASGYCSAGITVLTNDCLQNPKIMVLIYVILSPVTNDLSTALLINSTLGDEKK